MKIASKTKAAAIKSKRSSATPKPVVKKVVAKPAAKKVAVRQGRAIRGKAEPGFTIQSSGILVPDKHTTPTVVSPGRLQAGIESAKNQIKGTLQNLAAVFTEDFEVAEIELSVTFSADGKFLGFGTGGAMSIMVRIRPTK
jgi:hypothetical protein